MIVQTWMCLRFCSMPSQHLVISRIVSALDIRSLQKFFTLSRLATLSKGLRDPQFLFPHSSYTRRTHAA